VEDVKIKEIKRIDVLSLAVFGGVFNTLLVVIWWLLLMLILSPLLAYSGSNVAVGFLGWGILGLIIYSIVGFVFGFIGGAITAIIYNIVASIVGGIKIVLK